jgi:hypothetical protein
VAPSTFSVRATLLAEAHQAEGQVLLEEQALNKEKSLDTLSRS